MHHYDVDINALAPMIFLKNPNDLPIKLNILDPLKNVKDIFYFCADLFFKGIFYTYTNGNNTKVTINDLSIEQIYYTIKKLKNAKIQTNINVVGIEEDKRKFKFIIKNSIETVKKMGDNESLKDYYLLIPINEAIYKISFELL